MFYGLKLNWNVILNSYLVLCIPHENSKDYDSEIFEEIACAIVNNYKRGIPLCLIGDFNARTCNLADYIENNEFSRVKSDSVYNMEGDVNYDMLPERCNSDKCVDMNGTNLIELCKAFELAIANGRIGDGISGKLAFANWSTIYLENRLNLMKTLKSMNLMIPFLINIRGFVFIWILSLKLRIIIS